MARGDQQGQHEARPLDGSALGSMKEPLQLADTCTKVLQALGSSPSANEKDLMLVLASVSGFLGGLAQAATSLEAPEAANLKMVVRSLVDAVSHLVERQQQHEASADDKSHVLRSHRYVCSGSGCSRSSRPES